MMKLRKRPLSVVSCRVSIAKKFWFREKKDMVDYRDAMLHAVLVVGLNLGLRFV